MVPPTPTAATLTSERPSAATCPFCSGQQRDIVALLDHVMALHPDKLTGPSFS